VSGCGLDRDKNVVEIRETKQNVPVGHAIAPQATSAITSTHVAHVIRDAAVELNRPYLNCSAGVNKGYVTEIK
jgi:hypothetical protein